MVSLKFVFHDPINIIPALVKIMANGADQATSHYQNQWWPRLPTHVCVTGPQWVKCHSIFAHPSGLFQWHCGHRTLVTQPRREWVNVSHESTSIDGITQPRRYWVNVSHESISIDGITYSDFQTFMFGMLFLFLTTSLGCFCPRILLFE